MNQILDHRLTRIRQELAARGDALLITSSENRYYASNFPSSAGFVLLTDQNCVLAVDFRYYEAAQKAKAQDRLPSDLQVVQLKGNLSELLNNYFADNPSVTLLYEDRRTTVSEFNHMRSELGSKFSLTPCGSLLDDCRAQKDALEVQCIEKAQSITDQTFLHALSLIDPSMTELELALEMEYFMRKQGAEDMAFDTICVSGANSALPHGVPSEKPLGKGFVTMDFGAKWGGYCSDMTRTVCIGPPDDEMRRVYQTVWNAQQAAFAVIAAGVTGNVVDKAARDVIDRAGYQGCFGHSTGHSVGLLIHEGPNFSPAEQRNIPLCAVVSVEPGIYLHGRFGVRIEDLVLVTNDGYRNLTASKKDLIIL